jgi:hypothetical protein
MSSSRKRNKEAKKNYDQKYRREHRARYWATNSIFKHKQSGFDVEISVDFLEDLYNKTEFCQICGTKLEKESSKRKDYGNTPTLDRIDNEKVIKEDNCWIVCHSCNTMKGSHPMNQFLEKIGKIIERFK